MDKGTISNVASTCVLALGLLVEQGPAQALILSAGIFAFSGGMTNWLAVKMLFDRIPGLVGSGVIPARFREIRQKVKDLILDHFFQEEHLRKFFAEHQTEVDWNRYVKTPREGQTPVTMLVEQQWARLTSAEVIQPLIDDQLEKLTESSIGGFLMVVGVDNVRPAVNRFVTAFVASMQEKVMAAAANIPSSDLEIELDEERIIEDIRAQVDPLLEAKLQELDAEDVKRMMEEVMRRHLGWLIVWGNVFGGALGVVAYVFQVVRP